METILKIKSKIAEAEKKHHNNTGKVTLVAISKSQPVEKIKQTIATGQKHFGESYLKEALDKIKIIDKNQIIWHYIGRIQSKKTKSIALNFDWVQSVSSFEMAELLNKHRPSHIKPLNICIQVNISEETSKSGVSTDEILSLAKKIQEKLPKLKLRGLMSIPAFNKNFEQQLTAFKKLSKEFKKLQENGMPLDTLSMGMSHDFETAIEAGSTMVRIGSAIFGERN